MEHQGLSRKINEMGPNTPFKKLLEKEFGVETPEGTPLYQIEYIYKYCVQEKTNGTPQENIVSEAESKVASLVQRFPYIATKYDDIVNPEEPEKKSRKRINIPDNSVIHVVKNDRFYFWLGGVVTVSAKTVDRLEKCLIRKYGSVPTYTLTVKEKEE